MEHGKAKIDAASVQSDTHFAIDHAQELVRNCLEYLTDFRKDDRKKAVECKRCFYLRRGRIGGAAMTTQPCGICEELQHYGSTNTDKICRACGAKYELCVYCGGDLHMRPRRVFAK